MKKKRKKNSIPYYIFNLMQKRIKLTSHLDLSSVSRIQLLSPQDEISMSNDIVDSLGLATHNYGGPKVLEAVIKKKYKSHSLLKDQKATMSLF